MANEITAYIEAQVKATVEHVVAPGGRPELSRGRAP